MRTFVILGALALLSLPVAAEAGHRDHRGPPGGYGPPGIGHIHRALPPPPFIHRHAPPPFIRGAPHRWTEPPRRHVHPPAHRPWRWDPRWGWVR